MRPAPLRIARRRPRGRPRRRGPSARRRPARRRSSMRWDKRDPVERHHSSRGAVARALEHPTRTHRAGHPRTRPYLGLHRVGFTLFTPAAREEPRRGASLRGGSGGDGHGLCGTVRRLSPPRCYLAPCPAVSRLSSRGPGSWSPGRRRWRDDPEGIVIIALSGVEIAISRTRRGLRARGAAGRWRRWPWHRPRRCSPGGRGGR